jgi:hypothetical protein
MLSYISQIIVFLAAIVAIKGGTWDKAKKGIHALTVTGLITLILAVLGIVVSLVITYQSEKQIKIDSQKLATAEEHTKHLVQEARSAKEQRDTIKKELSDARSIMNDLRKQNVDLQKQNEILSKQSGRQLQIAFTEVIDVSRRDSYIIPRSCFGGEMIKFYFEEEILLVYAYEKDISRGSFRGLLNDLSETYMTRTPRSRWPERYRGYRENYNERSFAVLHDALRNFRERSSSGKVFSFSDRRFTWKLMKTVYGREVPIEGLVGVPCRVGIVNFSSEPLRGKTMIESTPEFRQRDD